MRKKDRIFLVSIIEEAARRWFNLGIEISKEHTRREESFYADLSGASEEDQKKTWKEWEEEQEYLHSFLYCDKPEEEWGLIQASLSSANSELASYLGGIPSVTNVENGYDRLSTILAILQDPTKKLVPPLVKPPTDAVKLAGGSVKISFRSNPFGLFFGHPRQLFISFAPSQARIIDFLYEKGLIGEKSTLKQIGANFDVEDSNIGARIGEIERKLKSAGFESPLVNEDAHWSIDFERLLTSLEK